MMDGTNEAYSKLSGLYETIVTKLFTPDHVLVADDGSPAPLKFKKMLPDKITVVYHGIDNKFYSPTPNSTTDKVLLFLDKNDYIIFSPHTLIAVKGVEYAIEAFARFVRITNNDNIGLLIAGNGSLKPKLEQLVIDLNIGSYVRFIGYIPKDEMPKYYDIADVVVATSLYSNMNLSVQEAMSCAKPVVAFSSGGTGRTIIDGETGLLVTPGDIDEFAQKLQILYWDTELRNQLGRNAREFIIKNRSWESRIKIELGVYESLLVTKHRNVKS
jgi:glycosyltransferase involved in cell wall biosynthesis